MVKSFTSQRYSLLLEYLVLLFLLGLRFSYPMIFQDTAITGNPGRPVLKYLLFCLDSGSEMKPGLSWRKVRGNLFHAGLLSSTPHKNYRIFLKETLVGDPGRLL